MKGNLQTCVFLGTISTTFFNDTFKNVCFIIVPVEPENQLLEPDLLQFPIWTKTNSTQSHIFSLILKIIPEEMCLAGSLTSLIYQDALISSPGNNLSLT